MNSNFKCKVMFFGEKKVTNRGKLVDNVVSVLSRQSEEISVLILKLDFNDITHLNQLSHVIPKSKIRQIILEMHHTENTESGKKSSIVSYLSMLRQLNDSGYQIYWNDRNWEFVQKGNPTCFTVNLYLGNTNKPTISNKIDLPNLEPFGAMPMEKSEKQKYESIYWGYISHHQILCQTMVRVGNIVDGGWEVCHDVQFRPRSPCLVYSFGINYDFSFDEDVAKTYGCEVHAFDPSMNIAEFKRPHLKFYKIGIGEANKEITFKGQKWKLNTLKTILERLNHSNRRIDVLKMDIEDNELQVLPEMIRSGAMRNVAQFYLEFHHYYDLGTLRQLHELGFRIFWSHQNPQAEVYENNRSNSYGNDVYFVNINIPT
ncbi:hypothetical protein FSP39_011659 [Pinctada imbricata]|uniref:Methyltransferase domain-containing protein n=1 Tax=Pinctada imbricata TaxID=66713 RepID=A0AA89BUQ3_PINIB|nr:hypothetical protein FSP39_011659 [Pinctada imbricata]